MRKDAQLCDIISLIWLRWSKLLPQEVWAFIILFDLWPSRLSAHLHSSHFPPASGTNHPQVSQELVLENSFKGSRDTLERSPDDEQHKCPRSQRCFALFFCWFLQRLKWSQNGLLVQEGENWEILPRGIMSSDPRETEQEEHPVPSEVILQNLKTTWEPSGEGGFCVWTFPPQHQSLKTEKKAKEYITLSRTGEDATSTETSRARTEPGLRTERTYPAREGGVTLTLGFSRPDPAARGAREAPSCVIYIYI